MAKKLNKYTTDQQQHLKLAPFAVFDAIAGADGVIEKKERQDFIKYIQEFDLNEHPLTHAVMESIRDDLEDMSKLLSEATQAHNNLYHLWSKLAKEWENEEIIEFREDLFNLGILLTGDFPSIGSAETMALAGLAILLEVDIENHPHREEKISPVISLIMEIDKTNIRGKMAVSGFKGEIAGIDYKIVTNKK